MLLPLAALVGGGVALNEFKKANQRIPCRVATHSEIDNAFKKEKELNGIKESPTIKGNLTITPCY